jgi:hypothetical protein
LVPGGGAEHDQKLETLKKILESFRPVFKRVLAEEIQNQSLDPLVQAIDDTEVSKAFASILMNLLGEIESHYVPVLESICEAFWKIGK